MSVRLLEPIDWYDFGKRNKMSKYEISRIERLLNSRQVWQDCYLYLLQLDYFRCKAETATAPHMHDFSND